MEELVCSLMELQNAAIHSSKDILKFSIFLEDSFVTVEPRERRTNVSISIEEGIKDIPMATRQLSSMSEYKWPLWKL
jgi:hypothetical protein